MMLAYKLNKKKIQLEPSLLSQYRGNDSFYFTV